jgi:glycosyltransferase involved in cell wall biosynthesis
VVVADATALPEVVGQAGRLVSPDNAEDWCRGMVDLVDDQELRNQFAKAGIERAREFDWAASAATLEDCYRLVLETTL